MSSAFPPTLESSALLPLHPVYVIPICSHLTLRSRLGSRITMFSIPYYSHLSLLPWDPPAFTLPDSSEPSHGKFHLAKSHKPIITLSSYPLPNGDWKWVSKSWMIDMRGDGQVQYDGFEYNWFFRKYKWSATSAAWVRRRRWIRLMMRPSKRRLHPGTKGQISPSASSSPSIGAPAGPSQSPALSRRSRYSWRSGIPSLPPSVSSPLSVDSSIAPDFIWRGDGVDDWERCHDYLRSLIRDGRKLETWKLWLGLGDMVESKDVKENMDGANINKRRWTEDEGLLPSQAITKTPKVVDVSTIPPREWIVIAIREHVSVLCEVQPVRSQPQNSHRWRKFSKPSFTPTPELSSSPSSARFKTTWARMLRSSSIRTNRTSGATRF